MAGIGGAAMPLCAGHQVGRSSKSKIAPLTNHIGSDVGKKHVPQVLATYYMTCDGGQSVALHTMPTLVHFLGHKLDMAQSNNAIKP